MECKKSVQLTQTIKSEMHEQLQRAAGDIDLKISDYKSQIEHLNTQ